MEELEAIRRKKLESLKHELSNKKGVEKISSATEVKDSTFDDFVKANKIVIIDCWAPWCGPCRSLSPIIEELAKEFEGKIAFGKLNTDENENIPMRFNISAIPTLLVFKNGEMVDRIVGAGNKAEMRRVTATRTVGDKWVVTAGLARGDKLVTQGLGRVKPGLPIRPVPDTTPQHPLTWSPALPGPFGPARLARG